MTKASLEFLKIPKNNINLKEERLIDWYENGQSLKQQLYQYREDYREKICKSCIGTQQQKKRNCHTFPGFDSNGNLKRSCAHMEKSESNKFRKKIYAHVNFHPVFFNPK